MTILNINIDKEKKEEISKIIEEHDYKSMSQFVRLSIEEKLLIEKMARNKPINPEIPEWVPDGKYVAFVNNAILAVGDSPQQVSRESAEKFPNANGLIIKRKGKQTKNIEYIFSSISKIKCNHYSVSKNRSFPIITGELRKNDKFIIIQALPDTAASLSLIKKELCEELDLQIIRQEEIHTAIGINKLDVVSAMFKLNDFEIEAEFLRSEIMEEFPFQILIGRNILDYLSIYLFGKDKIVCYKDP